jgi:hypothetical protein
LAQASGVDVDAASILLNTSSTSSSSMSSIEAPLVNSIAQSAVETMSQMDLSLLQPSKFDVSLSQDINHAVVISSHQASASSASSIAATISRGLFIAARKHARSASHYIHLMPLEQVFTPWLPTSSSSVTSHSSFSLSPSFPSSSSSLHVFSHSAAWEYAELAADGAILIPFM